MLKAWVRFRLACLFALILGIQAISLSYHETTHVALSAAQKQTQCISSVSDDCSLCAAQHMKVDVSFVKLEPTEGSVFPPTELWSASALPDSTVTLFSQPRAPPMV